MRLTQNTAEVPKNYEIGGKKFEEVMLVIHVSLSFIKRKRRIRRGDERLSLPFFSCFWQQDVGSSYLTAPAPGSSLGFDLCEHTVLVVPMSETQHPFQLQGCCCGLTSLWRQQVERTKIPPGVIDCSSA